VGVLDAKDTVKPEVEVAASGTGVAAKAWLLGEAKVIVWVAGAGASSPPPQALNTPNATKAHELRRICLVKRFIALLSDGVLVSPTSIHRKWLRWDDKTLRRIRNTPRQTPAPAMKSLSWQYGR
jgi:hypothetical protein